MNTSDIEALVAQVLNKLAVAKETDGGGKRQCIPIEVSARHVHLSAEALSRLFGPGASLTPKQYLSQPGEFLAEQRVKLVSSKGEIAQVAVLGPLRSAVQVELSCTDCRKLGLQAPLRLSGDLREAADIYLVGDHGMLEAKASVIIARNHLHLRPEEAAAYGVADGQTVRVAMASARPMTFDGVVARVRGNFATAFHIDTDEANACLLAAQSKAYLLSGGAGSCCELPPAANNACREPLSKETLITEALARKLLEQCAEKIIQLPQGVLITPSAKDVLNAAQRQILYY